MSTEEKVASLRPGDHWNLTMGMAGWIDYFGAKCDICGKEFQYCSMGPPQITKAMGPYEYAYFGKYKPSCIWYCRTHSNKMIEDKIKELDQ